MSLHQIQVQKQLLEPEMLACTHVSVWASCDCENYCEGLNWNHAHILPQRLAASVDLGPQILLWHWPGQL